ncbi:MAG TPA: Wzz/FepE/Etk N-terminal domain-containing protein, partial [Chthonomonadales bacterium]|nr:Wzz/FepE/Etk N-terminal domain-containing protein [Chthonomonadales bacterium]
MSEHAGYIESAGESTLSELVGAVWRRRWIVLTVMAASLGAAALITARMPRLYEARAVLRIVPAVVAMSPTQRMASPTGPVVESAESQAALMRTAAFHQAVRQYLTEGLRARRADAAGTSNDAAATMVAGGTQPAGMTVSSRTVFARSDPGVDELQSGGAAPGLRNAVLSFLALSWQTSLEIGAQPDTNVVYVTVRADNAQIARLSANAVAYSLDYFRAMQARERRARITREFASAAAGAIHEVNRLERRERQLREQSGIVDVSAETTALVTQLSTRQAEVATIENDVAAMRARARALAQRLASANASLRTGPGVRDPQLVLSLQKMLSDKEIERAAAAQKYTEEYPGILPDLDEQVRDLRNRLNQAVEAVSDNARPSLETHAQLDMEHRQARVQLVYTEARLAEARRAVARTRVALDRIPSKALAFARVQRELEVARQVAQAAQRAEAEA